MRRARQAYALAVLLLAAFWIGCPAPAPPPGGPVLVAEDPRYRVLAWSEPGDPSSNAPASLALRVEMQGGWHIAEEAPVKLALDGGSVAVAPALLRVEDAILLGEEEIEWRCSLGPGAEGATIAADLKLGICEGAGAECVIVKRRFEVEVAL